MKLAFALALASCLALGCGDDDGKSAYDEAVSEAQSCSAMDTCVIAGGVTGCRCEVAVRDTKAGAVNQAASEVSCEVEKLACFELENPRCDDNVCVADEVIE